MAAQMLRSKSYSLISHILEKSSTIVSVFLGVEGTHLIEVLTHMLCTYDCKSNADKAIRYILRYSVRMKQYHDERKITQKDMLHLSEPFNELCIIFLDSLRASERKDFEQVDAQVVEKLAQALQYKMIILINPFLTKLDSEKLNWLFAVLTNPDFITFILMSENVKKQREKAIKSLEILLEPLFAERDEDQCVYGSCNSRRLFGEEDVAMQREMALSPSIRRARQMSTSRNSRSSNNGNGLSSPTRNSSFGLVTEEGKQEKTFRSLFLCGKHHYKMYENVRCHPSLDIFLFHRPEYVPFKEFMEKHLPPNYLEFYKGAGNYQRAKWNVRKIFAQLVWEKYFQKNAAKHVRLPESIMINIRKDLAGTPTVDTYAEAKEYVENKMKFIFETNFLTSAAYTDYLEEIRLPTSISRLYEKTLGIKFEL